ncbi:glycoside hydrolase family 13 protein [Amycolatopsis australiensis]|uniref:Alpha-glucosidase n=1 Tax=Amycolatopsis australiensis TaxID=546364 RepID=A0A1K1SK09_9PSEU|nr:alpha-amylase family glycosyl hydrolase [Amycolatopsis australiensis]SFW84691.1 alpha-glucosidase [Amycolatopsis australiensis]
MDSANWWRDAVVYEVYVRSFADADGDGTGDLAGLRSRLGYLAGLGVDAVWATPWYRSPMVDGGYDVEDHRSVDPLFGTDADVPELVAAAHELGLRVLVDVVPNHTSDRHRWFRAALAAAPGSPERARYHFRAGRGRDGELPPTDWRSVFGGPAWTRVPGGEWYLHLFAPEQPDLNWDNAEVRAEFEDLLRFWFSRGVDGVRIDVAHGLLKDPAFPDLGADDEEIVRPPGRGRHPHWDLDGVHDIYRSWRRIAGEFEPGRVFVAEAWVDRPDRLARYVRPDELHTAFNFDFLRCDWDAGALRAVIDRTLEALPPVGAPATWVLSNHDVVRHVTRFAPGGDLARGTRRARAALLLMLALPGGAYLYQGEELGLAEVEDLPEAVLADPTWERSGHTRRGRDGCRVPLPWSGTAPPFGFGPEGGSPWLPQPAHWRTATAEAQAADPASMLSLYRAALATRRGHPALGDGTMTWLPSSSGVLSFAREPGFACLVNLSDEACELPGDARVLLASVPPEDGRVPPDAAVWLDRS